MAPNPWETFSSPTSAFHISSTPFLMSLTLSPLSLPLFLSLRSWMYLSACSTDSAGIFALSCWINLRVFLILLLSASPTTGAAAGAAGGDEALTGVSRPAGVLAGDPTGGGLLN